ncbi:hypothetical protein FB45DRAFT_1007366 [Roridomyces roridus]|uniref:MYND-type domain-containing protein n=1 Tax=Roridomyces roridus TaxID=1738132 RepID=A0AAD7FH93_9AGAR|nr:hypothetical protein FB45DRAFT_1007366 [Roridomyces roridus]
MRSLSGRLARTSLDLDSDPEATTELVELERVPSRALLILYRLLLTGTTMLDALTTRTRGRQPKDKVFVKLLFSAGLSPNTDRLTQEVTRALCIPDCDTSRGLKKCHESFETIRATLDKVFAQTQEEPAPGPLVACDHLAGAILLIYARMAQDNILCRRLVFDTPFLDKVVALLSSPVVRQGMVMILSKLCHQRDSEVLRAVARFTSTLLDYAEPHMARLPFVERTVCVLSHATTSIYREPVPDPEVIAALPRAIQFMLSVVRLPGSTSLSFDHLIMFCHETAPRCPAPLLANPDCLDLLVACARCPDICTRICSERALIGAFIAPHLDKQRQIEPTREETRTLLQDYYRENEPFVLKLLDGEAKLSALAKEYKANPDCSHSGLGQELASLVLHHEETIRIWIGCRVEGAEDVREMLRGCEKAVRIAADETNGLDVTSDILRISLLASEGDRYEASHYALEALKRHPSVPFFYFILASCGCGIGDDVVTRVLYAEKGLQCDDGMTEYLQLALLYIHLYYAHLLVSQMADGFPADFRLKEVNVLMETASANAHTWSRIAPVDHFQRPLLTTVGILIDLLRDGHTWTDEIFQASRLRFCSPWRKLMNFQETRTFYTQVCDTARCTRTGFNPMEHTFALDKILDRMSIAWDTWGSTVSCQPPKPYTTAAESDHSEVDIVAWFEKLNTGTCFSRMFELQGIDPGVKRFGDANLHTCSYCNNGNAALKKCAGCQQTRYCNNVCQKNHWRSHREACKASRIDKEDQKTEGGVEGQGDSGR